MSAAAGSGRAGSARAKVVVPKMTAAQVVTSVRRHFGAERDGYGPEYGALDEFSLAAGAGHGRADLFLVRAWSGRPKGHERVLIEVKVSRADLRHELAQPEKIEVFARHAHRVFFATPAGLVRPEDDLGEGVGLLEVRADGRVSIKRKAVRREDVVDVPPGAFVEAVRRASRAEARIRTAQSSEGGDLAARVVSLEKALESAHRAEQNARMRADRDSRRLRDWLRIVGAAGGFVCVCGQPLQGKREAHGSPKHAPGVECAQRWPELDVDALATQLGLLEPGESVRY